MEKVCSEQEVRGGGGSPGDRAKKRSTSCFDDDVLIGAATVRYVITAVRQKLIKHQLDIKN